MNKHGHWGNNYPAHLDHNQTFLGWSRADRQSLATLDNGEGGREGAKERERERGREREGGREREREGEREREKEKERCMLNYAQVKTPIIL